MRAEPVVVGAMTRGLTAFRPLALAYAALMAWLHVEDMNRPAVAVAVLAGLGAWTLVTIIWRTITWPSVAVDVGLAVAGILATTWAYPRAGIVAGAMTLPSIWSASGVVAAAIKGGERWGIAAALVVALADIVEVGRVNQGTMHNIVLLLLVGSLIGLSARLARESQGFFEASVRAEEAYAERERLSRVVHDGVLQTLSYIHRRGREIGGPGVELAEMAGEQERSLRALVTVGRGIPAGRAREELGARLRALESSTVSVSLPGSPVELPAERCAELAAAVAAAVDNVYRHAGDDARAWVLLEDLGADVEITVRDNGSGMPPGRLAEAAAQGRLGVAASIRGRLSELGGSAEWSSSPGKGCCVSLRAPKELQPLARPRATGGTR
ncbi:MAG: DUF5931 domain-containing protein [Tetrasphaera sp.]